MKNKKPQLVWRCDASLKDMPEQFKKLEESMSKTYDLTLLKFKILDALKAVADDLGYNVTLTQKNAKQIADSYRKKLKAANRSQS